MTSEINFDKAAEYIKISVYKLANRTVKFKNNAFRTFS